MPIKIKPLPPLSDKDIARFWKYVDKRGPDECWPWLTCNKNGLGTISITLGPYKAVKCIVSRIAYFLHHGKDPYPLLVCHTCDNRRCCNGSHLFVGTQEDNMHDASVKGRTDNGHLVNRGENQWKSRFIDKDIVAIRKMHALGVQQSIIASQYKVARGTINFIVLRHTWKHVP